MPDTTPASASTSDIVELTQLLYAFVSHLDERRYDALAGMFAPEGRWLRQGQWLEGRQAVLEALHARPATMRVRHIVSNVLVSTDADGSARVDAYMTAYRQPEGAPPSLFSINLVHNQFRREAGHWVLQEQRMVREFEFQGA